ncbi:MAG: FapA family protein [Spirochaetaceae bacterium]|jgi:uncharacterized protein (DUF342 family)|nr:FapA family protein [Spirochaetaceae bacterium]
MNDRVTVPVTAKNDGHIIVTFLNNDMEARADFMPPYGGGAPISGDYIKTLLSRLNIVYGVLYEEIEKTALAVNLSKTPQMNVLIAQGIPPVPACPAHFLKSKQLENVRPAAEDGEQADYRKFSPFVIVKKGQILAALIPAVTGQPGNNVHGKDIPFESVPPPKLEPGENTYADDHNLYAAIDGQLLDQQGILSVSDKLIIRGDVNYNTGDIFFPGDVEINGSVADGFKIRAGGNLFVTQTFNATDVIAGGNIEVLGGIIGRGQATLKAGGEIKARFIENCKVAARGNITINAEILNASVYTMGSLNVGERGFIIGVEVYAVHGMRCAKVGKTAGRACKIHVGVDFTVQQEIGKKIDQIRSYNIKFEKIKTFISAADDVTSDRYKTMLELRNKLDIEIKRLSSIIDDLQTRVVVDEKAAVTVTGEISQGTLVEICQVALFVDIPLRRVTLKFDKAQGRIVQTT